MAYEENSGGGDRKMHQGNWTCSKCGGEITQLPFEPDADRLGELKCRDCHSSGRMNRGDRQMHQGKWSCSSCGGSITELPFEPRDTGNLMCRDCFKKSKGF